MTVYRIAIMLSLFCLPCYEVQCFTSCEKKKEKNKFNLPECKIVTEKAGTVYKSNGFLMYRDFYGNNYLTC